eukprot:2705450-Pyramimonas_sp.AAC.1
MDPISSRRRCLAGHPLHRLDARLAAPSQIGQPPTWATRPLGAAGNAAVRVTIIIMCACLAARIP